MFVGRIKEKRIRPREPLPTKALAQQVTELWPYMLTARIEHENLFRIWMEKSGPFSELFPGRPLRRLATTSDEKCGLNQVEALLEKAGFGK